MKKVVLKVDFADEKIKQKAMKKVSGLSGLESIALDPKDNKLTVTGDIDPVAVVAKLRKLCHTDIVSVGPAKEPEKKKEDPKKPEDKKVIPAYFPHPYYYQHQYQQPPAYFNRSAEEDPNSCVIC